MTLRIAVLPGDGIGPEITACALQPPRVEGGANPSGDMRIALDLYANIRPARTREGLPHWGRTPMDLVIVRKVTAVKDVLVKDPRSRTPDLGGPLGTRAFTKALCDAL